MAIYATGGTRSSSKPSGNSSITGGLSSLFNRASNAVNVAKNVTNAARSVASSASTMVSVSNIGSSAPAGGSGSSSSSISVGNSSIGNSSYSSGKGASYVGGGSSSSSNSTFTTKPVVTTKGSPKTTKEQFEAELRRRQDIANKAFAPYTTVRNVTTTKQTPTTVATTKAPATTASLGSTGRIPTTTASQGSTGRAPITTKPPITTKALLTTKAPTTTKTPLTTKAPTTTLSKIPSGSGSTGKVPTTTLPKIPSGSGSTGRVPTTTKAPSTTKAPTSTKGPTTTLPKIPSGSGSTGKVPTTTLPNIPSGSGSTGKIPTTTASQGSTGRIPASTVPLTTKGPITTLPSIPSGTGSTGRIPPTTASLGSTGRIPSLVPVVSTSSGYVDNMTIKKDIDDIVSSDMPTVGTDPSLSRKYGDSKFNFDGDASGLTDGQSSSQEVDVRQDKFKPIWNYTTFASDDPDHYDQGVKYSYHEYKMYRQSGYGDAMTNNGCGPTSTAIVLSGFGLDVSPQEVANYMESEGYYGQNSGISNATHFDEALNHYGVNAENHYWGDKTDEENISYITDQLRKGNPIIFDASNYYTNGDGHFIVAIGLDENGNVLVINPGGHQYGDVYGDYSMINGVTPLNTTEFVSHLKQDDGHPYTVATSRQWKTF